MVASQNVSANIKCPYPFQIHATTSMVYRRNLAMLPSACRVAATMDQQLQANRTLRALAATSVPAKTTQPAGRKGPNEHKDVPGSNLCHTGSLLPFLFQAPLPVCFHRGRLPNKPVCQSIQPWREVWHAQNAGETTKKPTSAAMAMPKMKQYGPLLY